MARSTDRTKGSSLEGRTPGTKGIGRIPRGVNDVPMSGQKKAGRDSGWPGVAESSLGPDDRVQSAK